MCNCLQRKKAGINTEGLTLTSSHCQERGRDRAGVKQLDFRIHVLNHHIIVYVSFKNIFTFILFLVNCKFM